LPPCSFLHYEKSPEKIKNSRGEDLDQYVIIPIILPTTYKEEELGSSKQ